ncbi:PREDICTED: APOPT family protein CG14806, mitochondrial isoform X2 [Habropoda laboriosa]|uniref:APOPT family protein CG14806, mitochondrial isoform X2 n=1 Tax=Habropoda laboriosa TaxID=597456 RepID=UPI00083DC8EF|nr:PREDICTED: APOPT family protein CG14806, mitochondrial isoform X2 [Habropoda laboriosa]
MVQVCNYARAKCNNKVIRLFSAVSFNLKTPTQTDMIGPPDPISNLRPIIFAKFDKESKLEKIYREVREETQIWNQKFWTKHNISFIEERKRFQENLKTQGKTSINTDDMSVFYKEFLDKNWRMHMNYNIAWYKRNVKLLFLEIAVRMSKLKFK